MSLYQQSVVEVPRRTETGEAPADPGARRENIGNIRPTSNAERRDASPVECSGTSTTGCPGPLASLHREIVACTRCARLRAHCADIAAVKRAAYRHEAYWGKPLPGFGDPQARVLVVGLAPGAHGANRTGRMFTGDRSGLFLMTAMHAAGFATLPISESQRDGLELRDAWITAAVRCAPPDNKPTPQEFDACLPFLEAEWAHLPRAAVVVTLGKLAWDATWRVLAGRGQGLKPRPAFAHGASVDAPGGPRVLGAFHPSQQNTFTGRLTPEMLARVFHDARAALV